MFFILGAFLPHTLPQYFIFLFFRFSHAAAPFLLLTTMISRRYYSMTFRKKRMFVHELLPGVHELQDCAMDFL